LRGIAAAFSGQSQDTFAPEEHRQIIFYKDKHTKERAATKQYPHISSSAAMGKCFLICDGLLQANI